VEHEVWDQKNGERRIIIDRMAAICKVETRIRALPNEGDQRIGTS